MTVIQNTATDPENNPLPTVGVRIQLMTGSAAQPGYTPNTSIGALTEISTDQAGFWSANLTPNSAITPANTYYLVQEDQAISTIVVPATGGPYQLSAVLATPPPTPAAPGITGIQVAVAGTVEGARPEINLIPGAGMSISAADNAVANRVDITVAATSILALQWMGAM